MIKHILSLVGKKVDETVIKTYYDFKTQLSYVDKCFRTKVISNDGTSCETCTIENSDPDEFVLQLDSRLTETIETSDPDEFSDYAMGTTETRTIETSDSDGFYSPLCGTKDTYTIEASDPDSFVPSF